MLGTVLTVLSILTGKCLRCIGDAYQGLQKPFSKDSMQCFYSVYKMLTGLHFSQFVLGPGDKIWVVLTVNVDNLKIN